MMEQLHKLEATILGWIKHVPHLPVGVRKWLGVNGWWIVLGIVIIGAITAVFFFFDILRSITLLNTPSVSYYINPIFDSPWVIATDFVSLFFGIIVILLMAFAVQPLQARVKKGWVLLFLAWLVGLFAVVVDAILSLSPVGFIFNLLFGAIFAALIGYLLFEVHGQYAHDKPVPPKK